MNLLARRVLLVALTAVAGAGCEAPSAPLDTEPPDVTAPTRPYLLARDADRALVLSRLDRDPYASVYAEVVARAGRDARVAASRPWDHSAHGHNMESAQAAAFLAWLHHDADWADVAASHLAALPGDFETNDTWDVNIRMPHTLIAGANAWDLLVGAGLHDKAAAQASRATLLEVTGKFYDRYVLDDAYRQAALGTSQNNHPIRTAAAIGHVALAFPDAPEAEAWADWAASELSYLWGDNGQYVLDDGGVTEGPFYYGFAYQPSIAFFLAAKSAWPEGTTRVSRCINRQAIDPWAGHGCVEGEPFIWQNPLDGQLFADTVDWSIGIRLPSGQRPPLADAYFNPLNGAPLIESVTGWRHLRWDWEVNVDRPRPMTHGYDLSPYYLVHMDDSEPMTEPPYLSRHFEASGHAVMRSSWQPDARWAMLVAERGSAHKTLHDHVDSLSFSVAAYGEYLAVDPGYHKPNSINNAVTANAPSHNVVLIDGRGAPTKGLLTNWRDVDAVIDRWHDDEGALTAVVARQHYEAAEHERTMLMVDGRYFVIVDTSASEVGEPRRFSWRIGGYAGFSSGGSFSRDGSSARWERALAGLDVTVASSAPGLQLVEPPYVEGAAPHVHQFELDRSVGHHAVVDAEVHAVSPSFLAVLAPYAVGVQGQHAPLSVAVLAQGEGYVVTEVRGPDVTDLWVQRDASAPTVLVAGDLTVETDARAAWVRVVGDERGWLDDGTFVEVNGALRLDGAAPWWAR